MNRIAHTARFLPFILVAHCFPVSAGPPGETVWVSSYSDDPRGCDLEALIITGEENDLALPLDVVTFGWFDNDVEVPSYTYPKGIQHLVLRFSREWPLQNKTYVYPKSVTVNEHSTVQLRFEEDELHDAFFVLRLSSTVGAFLDENKSTNLDLRIEYSDESQVERKIDLFDSSYFGPGLAMFNACIGALESQELENAAE